MQLDGPLHNVGNLFREIDQATVEAEDLYHLLKSKPQISESRDAQEYQFKNGSIEFKNIKFQFENSESTKEKILFQDFNLKIEPGKINAIVGESGFGKTTLFNLILRIYDP